MEKLLIELIKELKIMKDLNDKKQREIINFLSFQLQIQKQILNNLIIINQSTKFNQEKNGNDKR